MDRERARAKVHKEFGAKPKLETVLAYYREQANDTSNSAKDRRLWKQLADEIDTRIGKTRPENPETDGLW